MVKFVVLAARRSGTTLLVKCLDSHPQIICHKEVFSTKRRFRYFQIDKPGGLFYKFRSARFKRRIDYFFQRKKLIDAFLAEVFTPIEGVEAIGIRLSYEQARRYPQALRWIQENEVKVIHLIRENVLKSIISDFTAKKRGVHHLTSQAERVTVQVSPYKLKRLLNGRIEHVDKYRHMFKNGPSCEVTYEAFVANRDAETRRLLDFLQIDQFVPLTSNLVKQNPDSLADILENYQEVAQTFAGTIFEKYLVM